MINNRFRLFSLIVSVFLSGVAHAAPPKITSLNLYSQVGDFVGQGKNFVFTSSTHTFQILGNSRQARVLIKDAKNFNIWEVDLFAPFGTVLQPGVYYNAERAFLEKGRSPGLNVSGENRGCNQIWGSFSVNQIGFSSTGEINLLDASFAQRCESATAQVLSGVVKYQALPLSFSLASSAEEPVTHGISKTYTSSNSLFSIIQSSSNFLDYRISGLRDEWAVGISAPRGKKLAVGTYQTIGIADDLHAGLNFSGNGVSCFSTSTGTLNVRSITFDSNGKVIGLFADFMQYCAPNYPPLRGLIHYYE